VPETADPAGDLVDAGIVVFRAFAVSHPSLFRVSVQRTLEGPGYAPIDRSEAYDAWVGLEAKVARLELGGRSVYDAASSFHALCEGLAALELRRMLPAGREEAFWRDALATLVRGFAAVPADEPASLPSV